jgi:uncharacterized protein YggE
VTLGFWSKDEDPNQALLNSISKRAELMVRLAALGIDQKDIQAFGANINSEAIIGPDGYPTDRLLYAVNQNINVTVHNPDKVGQVLNAIQAAAGAPYLFSLIVQSDLSEARRAEALAEAQTQALAEAKANAERLAGSLGLSLGAPAAAEVITQQITPSPMLQVQVTVRVSYQTP